MALALALAAVSCVLASASARSPVYVSMTTTPTRIGKIAPVLDSIAAQTVRPDRIFLHVPRVFRRDSSTYDIPEFVTSNPLVVVNRCEDYGPATKILPMISAISDPEAVLISIDDDVVYHPTFVETLLRYSEAYPEAVISGTTYGDVSESFATVERRAGPENFLPAELLEGYSGVLYKRRFLDGFRFAHLDNENCRLGDDYILSNHIRKTRTILITEPQDLYRAKLNFMEFGFGPDALHKGAGGGNNENYSACKRYLRTAGDLHMNGW